MNSAQYDVIVQEHDSTPWREDHRYTRQGAWNRVRALARLLEPGWPHPVWVRIWQHHTKRTQDGRVRRCRVLVYSADLRDLV